MKQGRNPSDELVDFITGKTIRNIGVEEHRQKILKFLVEKKGYYKTDIQVDADIEISVMGSIYRSQLDILLSVDGKHLMVIKVAAGSLESREKEVLSAARIFDTRQIPYAGVTDGEAVVLYDTISGRKIGEGLNFMPNRNEAELMLASMPSVGLSEKKLEKEKIIFRSYDSMNINVQRNVP